MSAAAPSLEVKISNNTMGFNQVKLMSPARWISRSAGACGIPLGENADLLWQVVSTVLKVCYLRLDGCGLRQFRQVQIKTASRLGLLPPYLFAELDRLKKEVASKGVDVISLSIGDPDLPTPRHIIEALKRGADDPKNHRYPDYEGLPEFRNACAQWYRRRFGVSFDHHREVCALIGSKEGIANFATAVVDPGDIVLIPDPGYPVYYSGCVFNGGEPYFIPLKKENGFRSRARLDSRRNRAPRQAALAQLSQQSHRRDG